MSRANEVVRAQPIKPNANAILLPMTEVADAAYFMRIPCSSRVIRC